MSYYTGVSVSLLENHADILAPLPKVTWLPDDAENPQTFIVTYKWLVTLFASMATLAVSLASSAYSGGIDSIERDFHPNEINLTLGT